MVEPLKAVSRSGVLYGRPDEIEQALEVAIKLPIREIVRRVTTAGLPDAEYVKSEVILHLIRQRRLDSDQPAFRALFGALRQRVLSANPLPSRSRGIDGRAEELQQMVLAKVQEYLCEDRERYSTRLDYFECRFNSAIAALRANAIRDLETKQPKTESLSDEESIGPSVEVELAFARIADERNRDEDFRNRLFAVIDSLPDKQRRVIEMMLNDVQFDSHDPDVVTIASTLGCTGRTVQNLRDRAFRTIVAAMKECE